MGVLWYIILFIVLFVVNYLLWRFFARKPIAYRKRKKEEKIAFAIEHPELQTIDDAFNQSLNVFLENAKMRANIINGIELHFDENGLDVNSEDIQKVFEQLDFEKSQAIFYSIFLVSITKEINLVFSKSIEEILMPFLRETLVGQLNGANYTEQTITAILFELLTIVYEKQIDFLKNQFIPNFYNFVIQIKYIPSDFFAKELIKMYNDACLKIVQLIYETLLQYCFKIGMFNFLLIFEMDTKIYFQENLEAWSIEIKKFLNKKQEMIEV